MMQLLATLFVLPVSRRAFRIANMIMMETLWSQLIWLVDWWSGVQVTPPSHTLNFLNPMMVPLFNLKFLRMRS
jgi:lysophosphatidic acid acyltransferase/lysophosphatidylinositol acyltransferase